MSVTNLKIVFLTLALAFAGCSNNSGGGGVAAKGPQARGRTADGDLDSNKKETTHRQLSRTGQRGIPVDRMSGGPSGQDSNDRPMKVEITDPEATITIETLKDRAVRGADNQEFNRNRDPILTPPPIRKDNEVPWFDSNKPYKSMLKVCGSSSEGPSLPPTVALQPAPPPPPPETPGFVIKQPLVPHTNALDILFVVDTSDSLDVVLPKIVGETGKFVGNLPPHNNYNIAVMLAHSPDSVYGSVPFISNVPNDRAVFKSSEMNLKDIQSALMKKIADVKNHRETGKDRNGQPLDGQGELGVLGLQNAVSGQYIQRWINDGFFREDAGLTVVFISDEQDVCFDYAAHPGIKPKYTPHVEDNDKYGRDGHEARAFAKYCKNVSAKSVVAAVRAVKGERPVTMTGILFKTEQAIRNSHLDDKYHLEHEIGYLYLDVIKEANGEAVELGTQDFGNKMARLGLRSAIDLSFVTDIEIKDSPQMVKCSSIEVRMVYPPAAKCQDLVIAPRYIRYEEPFVRVQDDIIKKAYAKGVELHVTYKWADDPAKRECTSENYTAPRR